MKNVSAVELTFEEAKELVINERFKFLTNPKHEDNTKHFIKEGLGKMWDYAVEDMSELEIVVEILDCGYANFLLGDHVRSFVFMRSSYNNKILVLAESK